MLLLLFCDENSLACHGSVSLIIMHCIQTVRYTRRSLGYGGVTCDVLFPKTLQDRTEHNNIRLRLLVVVVEEARESVEIKELYSTTRGLQLFGRNSGRAENTSPDV